MIFKEEKKEELGKIKGKALYNSFSQHVHKERSRKL